ncbi:hypothetical protein GA0115246_110853 [Streptomyces sp. SolWspMP-sol7th]|nr:hypothetical protein GA0115246_110853 [Streptomyces sp. SolWspMP-sol7th]
MTNASSASRSRNSFAIRNQPALTLSARSGASTAATSWARASCRPCAGSADAAPPAGSGGMAGSPRTRPRNRSPAGARSTANSVSLRGTKPTLRDVRTPGAGTPGPVGRVAAQPLNPFREPKAAARTMSSFARAPVRPPR